MVGETSMLTFSVVFIPNKCKKVCNTTVCTTICPKFTLAVQQGKYKCNCIYVLLLSFTLTIGGQGEVRGARCEEGKVRGSVRGGTRLVGYK